MPNTEERNNSPETLTTAANRFVEAVGDTHHEAHKQLWAAWQTYLASVRDALDPSKYQPATKAFTEGIQKSMAHQDPKEYVEAARQYSTVAHEAQEAMQTRLTEAYAKWIADVQQASAHVSEVQKTESENYVKALQTVFSGTDTSQLDAPRLAELATAVLGASVLRAHLA